MHCFDFVQLLELTENYSPEVSDYKVSCVEFQNIYSAQASEGSYLMIWCCSVTVTQPVLICVNSEISCQIYIVLGDSFDELSMILYCQHTMNVSSYSIFF